ncbi:MAG: glycosyltransferase family 2 protein [archaeon]|nr:glycosyltransferase family 2 protein [Candidatus Micrarchaeota archaeon]
MAATELIIYLPVYNAEATIASLLDRLCTTAKLIGKKPLNMALKAVILVNDGSCDNTLTILKGISREKTPWLHVLDKKQNKGAVDAVLDGMRKSLEMAAGNDKYIIVRMDSDLEHQPEDLLKLLQPIKDHKTDLVVGYIPFDRRNGFFASLFNRYIGLAESREFLGLDIPQFCPGFYATRTSVLIRTFPEAEKMAILFKKTYNKEMIAIDFVSIVLAKRLGNRISTVLLSPIENKWIKKMPLKRLFSYLYSHKEIISFIREQ